MRNTTRRGSPSQGARKLPRESGPGVPAPSRAVKVRDGNTRPAARVSALSTAPASHAAGRDPTSGPVLRQPTVTNATVTTAAATRAATTQAPATTLHAAAADLTLSTCAGWPEAARSRRSSFG